MDLTESYIKMCAESEEIQKLHSKYKDDIRSYIQYPKEKVHLQTVGTDLKPGNIWLPRQDQLQELYNHKKKLNIWNMMQELQIIAHYAQFSKHTKATELTFEKLWLMLIMKHNFNKIWNGIKWEQQI